MLSKIFDMEESQLYNNMSNDDVTAFAARTQKLSFLDLYHTRKDLFNSATHVKVRILYNDKLAVDFAKQAVKPMKGVPPIKRAIIHFHGGGFMC